MQSATGAEVTHDSSVNQTKLIMCLSLKVCLHKGNVIFLMLFI